MTFFSHSLELMDMSAQIVIIDPIRFLFLLTKTPSQELFKTKNTISAPNFPRL